MQKFAGCRSIDTEVVSSYFFTFSLLQL